MKEVMKKVETHRVYAFCECGGLLTFTYLTLATVPPMYPHECASCGNKENLSAIYPKVVHNEI